LSPDFRTDVESAIGLNTYLWIRDVSVWAMTAVTLYSGLEYSYRAFQVLRRPQA
jgi:hypothetical protein